MSRPLNYPYCYTVKQEDKKRDLYKLILITVVTTVVS